MSKQELEDCVDQIITNLESRQVKEVSIKDIIQLLRIKSTHAGGRFYKKLVEKLRAKGYSVKKEQGKFVVKKR